MNKPALLLLILLFATTIVAQTSDRSLPPKVVAFVNVNVIPMDRERVLPTQTVLVRDRTITTIGDAKRIKTYGLLSFRSVTCTSVLCPKRTP